uniref:FHA domain-containing protein n=1 Tax=Ornithorhynchus anatinus TaxID=9258 RepID=A0A6I8NZU0_ORNAN
MDDTQVVDWGSGEEEVGGPHGPAEGLGDEPVGRLHLFSSVHGPEKDFLLSPGENVVGRVAGCAVTLPFPSISKRHAVIEAPGRGLPAVLRDCGSLNRTRLLRPSTLLQPGRAYRLRDRDLEGREIPRGPAGGGGGGGGLLS